MIPPALFFFFETALTIQGLLCFHTNFRMTCSSSVKNAIGILIGITLNLYMDLGTMDILTLLILPIYEHGMAFHLFVSSSISLLSCVPQDCNNQRDSFCRLPQSGQTAQTAD